MEVAFSKLVRTTLLGKMPATRDLWKSSAKGSTSLENTKTEPAKIHAMIDKYRRSVPRVLKCALDLSNDLQL